MNVLFIENKYYIIYLCCPRKIKNADREIRTLKINLASKTSSYCQFGYIRKYKAYFLLHFQLRKNIAVPMLLIRPLGVEPRIAGYKPGATNRITLGAHKR